MNKLWKVFAPILVIILLVVATLFGIKNYMGKTGHHTGTTGTAQTTGDGGDHVELAEGAVVPDLKLSRFGGGEVRLSGIPAKVVLLNFWASWCEACVSEIPSLVALRKHYAGKGFEVVPLNVDENPDAVVPGFLKKFNIGFPVYLDTEGKNSEIFDVHGIPLTIIIRVQDRKILMVEGGERNWNSEEMHGRIEGWLK